jgi:hypothetical protein
MCPPDPQADLRTRVQRLHRAPDTQVPTKPQQCGSGQCSLLPRPAPACTPGPQLPRTPPCAAASRATKARKEAAKAGSAGRDTHRRRGWWRGRPGARRAQRRRRCQQQRRRRDSASPLSTGPPRDHGALHRHRHASATTLRLISLPPRGILQWLTGVLLLFLCRVCICWTRGKQHA